MTEKKMHKREWRKSDLYRLLYERMPWVRSKEEPDHIDIGKLAETLEYSNEAVYKWFRTGRMTARGAKTIVKASRKHLTHADLFPFVLG